MRDRIAVILSTPGTPPMKFALHFANLTCPDPADATRLAQAAETAGFESLIAIEHVVWPTTYASTYPYSPTGKLPGGPDSNLPDPLLYLAHIGALTTRIHLMTGVMILPQRNPLVLAKETATLDFMTGGRLELGVGIGWLREKFEAIGVPFPRRGPRTEEYIAAMRALWDGDNASFTGEFVDFQGMCSNPKPVRGRVPIHIGGHSEAAARRAGRIGDGFFPATGAQVDVAPIIDLARGTAAAEGRDPVRLEVTTGCPGALPGADGDPLEAVAARVRAGVDRVALPIAAFQPGLEGSLAAFGETVIAECAD